MMARKAHQHTSAASGEVHEHAAAIHAMAHAPHQIAPRHAVHQLNGAVVAKHQPLGQATNGEMFPRRATPKCQQQLVLVGLKARFTSRAFAEVQKPPQVMAKFRKGHFAAGFPVHVFYCIVIRYVISIASGQDEQGLSQIANNERRGPVTRRRGKMAGT